MSRSVPHNIDAEEALLGAMLLSNTACEKATAVLVAGDFYKPAYGIIYSAIVKLYERGQPVDPVTVADVLSAQGVLDDVGGPPALINLQSATPATSSAARYAKIISEHSVLRKLISAASEMVEACYDVPDQDGVDALLASTHERFTEALQGVSRDDVDDLWILDDFLDKPMESRPGWVIPGLLRKQWRCMVVAGEGGGKTVLLRQIGIAAAQGIHPLHFQPIKPVRTLIIDLENPEDSIHEVCQPIRAQAQLVAREGYDSDRAFLWHKPGGIDIRSRRDRIELETVIAKVQPDLVCFGPVYKSYNVSGGEGDESAVKEFMQVFDDLRTRYDFALVLEHHASKGVGKSRVLQPTGTSLWLRWPELGLSLIPDQPEGSVMKIGRWRGDRLHNSWPVEITRGGKWLWEGKWPNGTQFGPDDPDVPKASPTKPPVDSPFFGSPTPPPMPALPPGLDPETGEWTGGDDGWGDSGEGVDTTGWDEDPPF